MNSPNECPNCGHKDPNLGAKVRSASKGMHKSAEKHPLVAGFGLGLLAAHRLGLIPTRCPRCGTQFWIGGRLSGQ
jgi:predicted RNA-binding Zn-ribbon protein involved in translation (DUF1610 family)